MAVLAVAFSVGPMLGVANAATVPSAQHPTIQAAINDTAGVPNGSTIYVQPGVYYEALFIGAGRSVTIRGIAGPASTIVDAAGKGAAAINVFRATSVTIRGLTFRNGAPPTASGGGFVVQESSPSFIDCIFESNAAVNGGGGTLITSNATFAGCIFRNNAAAHFGGGVYIVAGSRPVFTQCDFLGNASGTGGPGVGNNGAGGAVHSHDSSPTFRFSRINGNTSKFAAGGLFHMGVFGSGYGRSMLVVEDTEIADNVSSQFSPQENPAEGGGMHVEDNATATLTRVRILRNRAGTGGGINAYRAQYDIVDSVIASNQATNGFGGGIAATSNNPNGPVHPASVINLTQTLVRSNTASTAGGGIAAVGDNFCGGGVPTCTSVKATLTIASSVVDGNQAPGQGGGILLDRTNLTASNSIVLRNRVTLSASFAAGGGLAISTASSAAISNTAFSANVSDLYGGGIFMNDGATIQMTGSQLYANTEGNNEGGGLFVGGTALSGTVQNSTFADNSGYQIVEDRCPALVTIKLGYQGNSISGGAGVYNGLCGALASVSSFNNHSGSDATSGNNANLPSFAKFLAVPTVGSPITLAWTVARATTVTIAGVGSFNQASGTVDVTPTSPASYSLTASLSGGGSVGPIVVNVATPPPPPPPPASTTTRREGDFDGDGRSDIGVFRPSNGNWYIRYQATGSGLTFIWGGGTDRPVVGDYDGDGRADMAVFRPSTGTWYVRYTATGAGITLVWGGGTDVPVPGDYDGDGRTDIAVFRPSNGTWYVRYAATGTGITLVWGGTGDVPAVGDYDGDGRTDIAVFRPSTGTWFVRYAATGTGITLVWGGTGDVPVVGDYDGDGRSDIAIFRVSSGTWFIRYTATGGGVNFVWGGGTDIPAPGDYDGDGLTDLAVFRPPTGTWFIRYSATGAGTTFVWGGTGDIPVLGPK